MKKYLMLFLLFLAIFIFPGCGIFACRVAIYNAFPDGGSIEEEGKDLFHKGDTIDLSAKVNYGYEFKGWYVDGELLSSEAEYTYTVSKSVKISGDFQAARKTLTLHGAYIRFSYENTNNDLYHYRLNIIQMTITSFERTDVYLIRLFDFDYSDLGWLVVDNFSSKTLQSNHNTAAIVLGKSENALPLITFDLAYQFSLWRTSDGNHMETQAAAITNSEIQFKESSEPSELTLSLYQDNFVDIEIVFTYSYCF